MSGDEAKRALDDATNDLRAHDIAMTLITDPHCALPRHAAVILAKAYDRHCARIVEFGRLVAAMRPKAEAAERYVASARALLKFTDNPPMTKDCWRVHDAAVMETQAAHDALLDACPPAEDGA